MGGQKGWGGKRGGGGVKKVGNALALFLSLFFLSKAHHKCLTLARQKEVTVYFSRFLAAFNCQCYLGIFILNHAKSHGATRVGLQSCRLRPVRLRRELFSSRVISLFAYETTLPSSIQT